jgi:glyoxylase-like metal-dependent hydrolase (beta-lactamase superfamily II)
MIHPVPMHLHIPAGLAGPEAVEVDVRAFLVEHPAGFTLIDTGMAPEPSAIGNRLAELGAQWTDVSDVVLTHNHPDHTGGLAQVRELAPKATVWASPLDPHVGLLSPLSEGVTVRGLRALALPGHTPGHIGLIHAIDGTVFAGDTVGVTDGRLVPAPERFTADLGQATLSMRRLAEVTGSRLLFSHGPEIGNPVSALHELLDRTT